MQYCIMIKDLLLMMISLISLSFGYYQYLTKNDCDIVSIECDESILFPVRVKTIMTINNSPFGMTGAFDSKEGERRSANQIKKGKIVEARYGVTGAPADPEQPNYTNEDTAKRFRGAFYRVEFGDHKTYWIPHLERRSGKDQSYWAYEVGEQVLIVCPDGDMRQAVIIGAIPSDAYRPPVGYDDGTTDKRPWRETVHRIRYEDDTLVEYDREKHRVLIVFADQSKVRIQNEPGSGTEIEMDCTGEIRIKSGRGVTIQGPYVSVNGKVF